jgi:hypothetical protein
MLAIYSVLECTLFVLAISVSRMHYYLWHICPGNIDLDWDNVKNDELFVDIDAFYNDIQYLPLIEQILLDMFGMDVGPIVFEYFQQIPNQDCD